ncbi:hypothetical protein DPMN_095114 [Dreissena polymorpha]|uniref:Uncharacterized protein n=1 Tax=Dreissena polymorpha TaxID=45954 RepID=A0A9D4R3H6_DREPO|nr:hypothetical protein DPMN_095114 [Dreissena polymorpha]
MRRRLMRRLIRGLRCLLKGISLQSSLRIRDLKENCGSLFSELSVVEIKKASAAPRECVSTVVCYLYRVKYIMRRRDCQEKYRASPRLSRKISSIASCV